MKLGKTILLVLGLNPGKTGYELLFWVVVVVVFN